MAAEDMNLVNDSQGQYAIKGFLERL